ncbi:MAG: sigma-54-dependent Fis family transcriptional regulator [Gammaproteobacteria bacterium]|nr:sigma-54-dependent Fis family transcriptional regulator [Gammaproteobacteria bacterium]
MKHQALIVDDEPAIRELVAITLRRMGIDCMAAASVSEAKGALREQAFDLCLTDMRLPDGNGLGLIAHIQQRYPRLPVAMITAHGNMESAIQALKAGAFDFVNKPVDINDLRNLVAQALKAGELKLDAVAPPNSPELIGRSGAIQQLHETIAKVARSQAPVYISGESGSGKELVARLIHVQGPRTNQPFIPVNCGAIPHELIESELFGHLKGSFTGAVANKVGLFQAANGGTLFLDEVADLPLLMQVKLLRAIQEKRVRKVGAPQEETVDCRILSATHKDLAELVDAGTFRQDLYYRINVIELKVPPLRARGDDILLLAEHVVTRLAAQANGVAFTLSDAARTALLTYRFPGNVRELENILERAVTLCDGTCIEPSDLRLPVLSDAERQRDPNDDTGELQLYLDNVERKRILDALEKTRWNKTQAAKQLGISFRALRYRLEKLGIE